MHIETLAWGKLEVAVDQIYRFSKGIPGFEEETEFVLIPVEGEPFSYMQSMKQSELSFLLSDPFVFYPDYEFELPDGEAEELEIDNEVMVRCVITLKEQVEKSTINLLAPIVLNPVKRLGKQIVLHSSPYQTRNGLWSNLRVDVKDGE